MFMTLMELIKITASNSGSLDEFGGAVAVGNGKIVVGAKFRGYW